MTTPRLPALALIIITNAIPLIGVLLFGWELRSVLLLYWAENIIIGAATLLRLLTYSPKDKSSLKPRIPLGIFLTIHYGIFCFVHLVFLLALTSGFPNNSHPSIPPLETLGKGFTYAIITMIAYQLYDYYTLFIKTGKIHTPKIQGEIMASPYKHIVVIHIAIILGAFIAISLGSPIAILLIIIIGKTLIDLKSEKSKTTYQKLSTHTLQNPPLNLRQLPTVKPKIQLHVRISQAIMHLIL